MSERERWIVIAAVAVAGLWLGDAMFLSPWMEEWDLVNARIYQKEKELEDAEMLLERELDVARAWKGLEDPLTSEDRADTQAAFIRHMGELEKKAGVRGSTKASRETDLGDFTEISLEMTMETDIDGLRNLLVELYNSREFLKVSRLSINAHPFDRSRRDKIDISLTVSTIDYHPKKRNGKNGGRKS